VGTYVINEGGALEWDPEGATSAEEIEHPLGETGHDHDAEEVTPAKKAAAAKKAADKK